MPCKEWRTLDPTMMHFIHKDEEGRRGGEVVYRRTPAPDGADAGGGLNLRASRADHIASASRTPCSCRNWMDASCRFLGPRYRLASRGMRRRAVWDLYLVQSVSRIKRYRCASAALRWVNSARSRVRSRFSSWLMLPISREVATRLKSLPITQSRRFTCPTNGT